MRRNFYPGKTISELLPIRERLMEARNGGSLTSVGIEPRISNQFNKVSTADLNNRLDEVDYSLYLIAAQKAEQGDCTLLELYPNPYDRPAQTIPVYVSRFNPAVEL